MMTDDEARTAAQSHVAELTLGHPDYDFGFSQPKPVAEGWNFDYTIEPVRPIPESRQESFGGAPGFIVPSDGSPPRVVPWNEFQERKLWETPPTR